MERDKVLLEVEPEVKELFLLLKRLKDKFDSEFVKEFDRSLPFADILFDRWERAALLGFGEGSSIYDSSYVFGNVRVGINTWVGPFTILDGTGGLTIGNNCSISASVQLYSHDTVEWAISGGKEKYKYAPTIIGDNCYIGPGTIISMGVVLGEGCVVGTNSFVNKSFAAGSKIAGTPAKSLSI